MSEKLDSTFCVARHTIDAYNHMELFDYRHVGQGYSVRLYTPLKGHSPSLPIVVTGKSLTLLTTEFAKIPEGKAVADHLLKLLRKLPNETSAKAA